MTGPLLGRSINRLEDERFVQGRGRYIDDLAASTRQAKELGATMIMENIPVANYGKFTIFKDPTGAVIAMWQGLGQT